MGQKKVLGIIPARMGSTRFANKPLADIAGSTMIQRVYERAEQCSRLDNLIVATDSEKIAEVVAGFRGRAILTSADHPTGLDRILEVFQREPAYDIYINIQGDEPLIAPATINGVIENFFKHDDIHISTSAFPFTRYKDSLDENQVKVVLSASQRALYFSRSQVPHTREDEFKVGSLLKHLGIYGYTAEALKVIGGMPISDLEQVERLEQLRFLYHGLNIYVAIAEEDSIGVDVPADIDRVIEKLRKNGID